MYDFTDDPNDQDDAVNEPTDDDLKNQSDPDDQNDVTDLSADDLKHKAAEPPSVKGEEDTMSGDMPQEAADIDEELEKVGLSGDKDGVKPLDVSDEIDEDEKAA